MAPIRKAPYQSSPGRPEAATSSRRSERPREVGRKSRGTFTPRTQKTLGRMLQNDFLDRAPIAYGLMDDHYREELKSVDLFVRRERERTMRSIVHPRKREYDAAMAAMQAAGLNYDPSRITNDMNIPQFGQAARLVSVAKHAWKRLQDGVATADGWNLILDDSAENERISIREGRRSINQAQQAHWDFLHVAKRRALRWRLVGKSICFVVRCLRTIPRAGRLPGHI